MNLLAIFKDVLHFRDYNYDKVMYTIEKHGSLRVNEEGMVILTCNSYINERDCSSITVFGEFISKSEDKSKQFKNLGIK